MGAVTSAGPSDGQPALVMYGMRKVAALADLWGAAAACMPCVETDGRKMAGETVTRVTGTHTTGFSPEQPA
ncbi:hypothetical protein DIE15_05950 [Burkholderia sp. Bp9031]|nr:hypothetical protein DIE15_05950 [Burkholderia sp. Bp9031]